MQRNFVLEEKIYLRHCKECNHYYHKVECKNCNNVVVDDSLFCSICNRKNGITYYCDDCNKNDDVSSEEIWISDEKKWIVVKDVATCVNA